jgi:hypothetical protein
MDGLARESGFRGALHGAAMSLWEMHVLPHRFAAAMNPSLREESRNFLLDLTFDTSGFPLYRGARAGIDGCYRLTPLA